MFSTVIAYASQTGLETRRTRWYGISLPGTVKGVSLRLEPNTPLSTLVSSQVSTNNVQIEVNMPMPC